jgi:photosynthetic reaction center H subunit
MSLLEDSREPLRAVPDLAGTPVIDVEGHHVGQLHGSIVEVESGMLRYLDVELASEPRHVLIPMGHVRIEQHLGKTEVQLRAATREELKEVPEHADADLCSLDHESLLDAHGRAFCGERYYSHPAFDHHAVFVGDQPIIRAGTPAGVTRDLALLGEAKEYRLANDQPDVRGWTLLGCSEERIGVVRDLVVDTAREAVRYALIDLENGEPPRLVPIGYLEPEPGGGALRAAGLERTDVEGIPAYPLDELTRAREEAVRAAIHENLKGKRRFQRRDFAHSTLPAAASDPV